MAQHLTLKEMLALRKRKVSPSSTFSATDQDKPKINDDAIFDLTPMDGTSVKQKLEKIFYIQSRLANNTTGSSLPAAVAAPTAVAIEVEVEYSHTTVAICLVIVDQLHHEDIWRHWATQSSEGSPYQVISIMSCYSS